MPNSTTKVCGRQAGRRMAAFFPLATAIALTGFIPGCGSRSTASRSTNSSKPDSVSLRAVAQHAASLADNATDPKRDDTRPTKLDLRLNRTEIDPDTSLTGTISGATGNTILTLLWVDAANRVIGVVDVTPAKEKRSDPINFSIPFPKTAMGQLHRLILVSALEDDKKNKQHVEAQALFHVRTPAVWDDYVAMVRGTDSPDEAAWEKLREAGINGGACSAAEMPGPFVRHALPFCTAVFQPNESPFGVRQNWAERVANYIKAPTPELLQRDPALFDEQAMAKVFQRIDSTLADKHGFVPLGWSLGNNLSLTSGSAPFDYDMSPSTLQVFQGWLQKRYGTLEALNKEWGTNAKTWEDVRPATTDIVLNFKRSGPVAAMAPDTKVTHGPEAHAAKLPEPSAAHLPGHENFAAWSDFRAFNDFAFARLLREYRSRLLQCDPLAHTGLAGVPQPAVFGGWDYWQVSHVLDWAEEHESANGRELLRNFNPQMRWVSQVSGATQTNIYELWTHWMSGDYGCIVDSKTMAEEPPELTAELKLMTRGITMLRENAELISAPAAIYYSPRSMQIQWLLDCQDAGSDWLLRDKAYEARHNTGLLELKAWSMLLQDLGYVPSYVYPNDVVAGSLKASRIKVLILPKVLALSDAEAVALRAFALNGGVIVADGACGTFDGSGRRRSNSSSDAPLGILDGDFGIVRKDLRINELNGQFQADPTDCAVTMRDGINKPAIGPESAELRVLEPGILIHGGRANAWSAAGTPALLNKTAGGGRFIYLNLSVEDYPTLREGTMADDFLFHGMSGPEYVKKYGVPTGGEALRLVIGDLLDNALPPNPLHVWSEEGTPLRGLQRVRYSLGKDADLFAVLPLGRTEAESGKVSGQSIKEPTKIWVGVDQPRHWFDVRSGTYLGWGANVKVTADPNRPLLLTAFPYQTDRVNLKIARTDARGIYKVQATLMSSLEPVMHVFHVEVTDPSGKILRHYTQNVVADGGKWSSDFALGMNEPNGHYRLVVHDIATGATGIGDLPKDFADYSDLLSHKDKE